MLYFNELSFHGQFSNSSDFERTLALILAMRQKGMAIEWPMAVSRGVAERLILPNRSMRDMLGSISRELKRAALLWLDRSGPFWEDAPNHPDDYFQCNGEMVTGTALADAAYRVEQKRDAATISADPSRWHSSPLPVVRGGESAQVSSEVANFTALSPLASWLAARDAPITSWSSLETRARARFGHLRLSDKAVAPLASHPFHRGAAERILELLGVLDRLAASVDCASGAMTASGLELLQQHFVGEKAWFSDSSDSEKAEFRKEMTFPHPSRSDAEIFASWHGKIKIGQLRIHYDHSFLPQTPVSVLYIGPKITRR